MQWVQLHLKISYFYFHGWFFQIFNSNISILNCLPKLKSLNHAKKKPMFKTLKNAFKILKKYVWVTAHLNFNFWYCNPIFKARQGHKLKFSCPKWAFCHMLEHSNLCSSSFSLALWSVLLQVLAQKNHLEILLAANQKLLFNGFES